jgi:hypothetical protein
MASALKGVPVAPLKAPPGLAQSGSHAVYAELANGGWIDRIAADTGVTRAGPPLPAPEASDTTDRDAGAAASFPTGVPGAAASAATSQPGGRTPGIVAAPAAAASTP